MSEIKRGVELCVIDRQVSKESRVGCLQCHIWRIKGKFLNNSISSQQKNVKMFYSFVRRNFFFF